MLMTTATKKSASTIIRDIGRDYVDGLKNLINCPREIWIAYLVKILESICYFSSVLILMPFLTKDMNLSDQWAGTIFGIFSASMSFFMLFVGFIADSLGIKRALLIGLVIALIGRIAITFTTNPYIVYPGLLILSVGFAYMIPLIAASVKLFTTNKAQKYAYSWYYVVMNIGALIAGLSRDWLRGTYKEDIYFSIGSLELTVRPLQIIFFMAIIATIFSLILIVFFVRDKIPEEELRDPVDVNAEPEKKTEKKAEPARLADKKSAWTIMKEVTREKTFWIFIIFIALLILVKMIFQYNHSLYPVYMERIGLDDWTGKIYSINPFMIIFLVPVMTAITHQMKSYNVILLGCFISAGSVLIMGLGESLVYIIMFQIFLSIGEALGAVPK